MSSKYVAQVGGKHYEKAPHGLQHWDVMEKYNVSYLEAVATKYLMRWRDKGGVEDLKKSKTYLQKMGGRGTINRVPIKVLAQMANANQIPGPESLAITLILGWEYGTPHCLEMAESIIDSLITAAENNASIFTLPASIDLDSATVKRLSGELE